MSNISIFYPQNEERTFSLRYLSDIDDGTLSMEKLVRMVNSLNWHSLFLGSSSNSRLLAGICHFVLVG